VSVTGIVAALAAEARTLGAAARHGSAVGRLADGNLVAVSGMGPGAATRAALDLVAAGARQLLSFGLAGALDPRLGAGTVLLADAVLDEDGAVHATCAPWRERLAARAATRGAVGGAVLSVAQPLLDAAAKAQARQRSGASAVDMESFAIGSVAVRQGVEFAVARVVVDTAADAVPASAMAATGPRGEVRYPRLLLGVLGRPQEIPALLRLSRRYRTAMESLAFLARQGVGPG